jgi:hypothetical protein
VRASAVLVIAAGLVLAGCSPKLPKSVDEQQLSEAVGRAIGGPNTCVLIADKGGHRCLARGRLHHLRPQPAHLRRRDHHGPDVLKAVRGKPARFISCPSGPGANTVGWAMGPVPTVGAGKPDLGLSYVAVMEGERALPGREVGDRVEEAFAKAGL